MRKISLLIVACAVLVIAARSIASAQAGNCNEDFDSTFALIEKVIFEGQGCTSQTSIAVPSPRAGSI
jgi:hypothetical protein